jgi:polar amino acid transport system substrate-binding protein
VNVTRILLTCLAVAMLAAGAPFAARAAEKTDVLHVYYLERPPYYWTEAGRPRGFLMNLTSRVLDKAGISATFSPAPAARILEEIRRNNRPLCSIGWFRTSEREAFATFSLPIYRDHPLVLLTSRENAGTFEKYETLQDVFADTSQVMAQVASFSYGEAIDGMLRDTLVRNLTVSSSQTVLPRLILSGRATYMLIAPEEVQTLVRAAGLDPEQFVSLKPGGVPAGNIRHLMFSRNVPQDVLRRVNQAIEAMTDQQAIITPN